MTTKLNLRENLELPSFDTTSDIENFQNEILRPILKLQNDLYTSLFHAYAIRQKTDVSLLGKDKKRVFIEQSLQKDVALKNLMLGITVGLLTRDEWQFYLTESKECNRRIMTMLVERMTSQLL